MLVDEFVAYANFCSRLAAAHIIEKLQYAENNPQEEEVAVANPATVSETLPAIETTANTANTANAVIQPSPVPINPPEQKIETPSSARRKSMMASKVATALMVNSVKKRLSKIEMEVEQDVSTRQSTTLKFQEEKEPPKIDRILF